MKIRYWCVCIENVELLQVIGTEHIKSPPPTIDDCLQIHVHGIPFGLVVRISGFHPGSIPRVGIQFGGNLLAVLGTMAVNSMI